ncbi:MAG: SRPBCC domain-containing protein, partial [Actinomycetia bacterium]|nr:SRPBCC domain-containing protein [Actinomycetes bacterium]
MQDRIERETLIAAPVEHVWSLVAEPGWWATANVGTSGAVAEEGAAYIAHHSEHGDFPVRVEKVEPPTYLAYRWVSAFPGEDLSEGNSTLVEFFLKRETDGTRLRVVESGFAALPTSDDNRSNGTKDHTTGWGECFGLVKTHT